MNPKLVISAFKPQTAGNYSFKYAYQGSDSMTLMDSYDYLLMKKGCCLLQKEDGSFLLLSSESARQFGNLDEEELKKLIDSVVLPRVLLEKHRVDVGRYDASMVDELEKTVAKGEMFAVDISGDTTYALRMNPLRGYSKETSKGLASIREVKAAETLGDAFKEALAATGDELLSYSAKPVLHIKPEMPLYKVMHEIYSHLIYVMAKNTEGIIEDIDIEFLHDFRVSVRRTRSALSLIRGVYGKDVEKEFRGRFRELGSLTGLARDMDVYLDMIDDYDSMLPEWLKGGMSELADHFAETRNAEYKKLGEYLKSGDFDKLYGDWQSVFATEKFIIKKGKKPVLPIAKKAIYEAFTEIEKQAVVLDESSPSDLVHDIRISFKKIRYLLEFYSSLFESSRITPMLKDMKVLQDSLGDHNDYYVQQLMLEELMESGEWNTKTATACGFLTAMLAEKQSAERVRSLRLIIEFMNYKKLFGELFI